MRYRVTVRGDKSELRGYITTPTEEGLRIAAQAVTPIGLMVASPAEDDFDPFAIDEPDHPPTIEASLGIIEHLIELADGDMPALMQTLAGIHYRQAMVIRGERGRRMAAEKELLSRELHHFETEEENARLKTIIRDTEGSVHGT